MTVFGRNGICLVDAFRPPILPSKDALDHHMNVYLDGVVYDDFVFPHYIRKRLQGLVSAAVEQIYVQMEGNGNS